MEGFDVMFSGKAVYASRKLMAIKPMTSLNLLLVCELIHNAEKRLKLYQLIHIIVFGHEILALVIAVICTADNKKRHTIIPKISKIHFRMIFQSSFTESHFSRYNDSLFFLKHLVQVMT